VFASQPCLPQNLIRDTEILFAVTFLQPSDIIRSIVSSQELFGADISECYGCSPHDLLLICIKGNPTLSPSVSRSCMFVITNHDIAFRGTFL
jgi:hypothetical protein